ncbi:hypothetical protein H0H92_006432, partial [Tricholoma furcatifolium]
MSPVARTSTTAEDGSLVRRSLHRTCRASVNSLDPIDIQWDPTCIDSTNLDIHLLTPWYNGGNTEMTVWSSMQNSLSKNFTIEPKLWNSTASIQVQLAIVAAGQSSPSPPAPSGPRPTPPPPPPPSPPADPPRPRAPLSISLAALI